jgi:hypothetical protein
MFSGLGAPHILFEIIEICFSVNREFATISLKTLLEMESGSAMGTIQICIAPVWY